MSDELPKGWTSVELEEHVYIAGRIGWRGLKRAEYTKSGPRFLAVKNILPNGEIDFTETDHLSRERYDESPEIQLKRNDILLTKDGTIGKVGMVDSLPSPTTVNSSILVVRPNTELLIERYLFHYLRGPKFQEIARERITGSAIPHLFQKDIKKLRALVPPVNEQGRIVAKLETLLDKVDAGQQRLAEIPVLLKRFRQSVLAAACSGRLTSDWREANPDAKPYPAEAMECEDEFPTNWFATRLSSLTTLVTSGSRGWAKYYSDSGSTFIRAQNINSDFLNLDDIAFVRPPVSAEGLRTRVQQHDILITITGANVTKSALVEKKIEDAYVSQHVALVRLKDNRLANFLFHSIVSPTHGRKQLLASAYGQGKPGLNLENIRDVVVGLPPLPEQQEIVRRVEGLFALADQLEARLAGARAQVEKLTPSLLAKAFRGELVPQDPNDEPAEKLLERIQCK